MAQHVTLENTSHPRRWGQLSYKVAWGGLKLRLKKTLLVMIILLFGVGKNKKVLHAVVTVVIEEGF